jgi:hypothetical protein
MKRLTMLLACLLDELASQASLCAERDKTYVMSRVKHEGLGFLTLVLPSFEDGLLAAIERGFALPSDFLSFKKSRRRSVLPAFLQGYTSKVFDGAGQLREDADADSIYSIRQICSLFKKIRMECSEERNQAALKSYLANEATLFSKDEFSASNEDKTLDAVAAIITSIFRIDFDNFHPRHGPGVTADRLLSNDRKRIRKWHERGERSFPMEDLAIPNWGYNDQLSRIDCLPITEEPAVKVVFVPKTVKTPRVIAIEPSHMQYLQQGVCREMVRSLESHRLTRRSVNFTDQTHNRKAARLASVTRAKSTIDMKDASDLVSLKLVQRLFKTNENFLMALEDSRSLHALLPDKTPVLLRKFASMGSATCFPVEAVVFYCLIQAAVHDYLGLSPRSQTIEKISGQVLVYGDDIIVPVAWHDCVVRKLEDHNLRVNQRKSFKESHFRESCGGDFYKGKEVRPSLLREMVPDVNDHWPPKTILSVSELSDQLYALGLWSTCRLLRSWIEKAVKCKVPLSTYKTDGLTFFSCLFDTYDRWNSNLQRFERKVRRFVPVRVTDDISEDVVASITAALGNIGNETSFDFSTSVKSRSLRQKSAWAR